MLAGLYAQMRQRPDAFLPDLVTANRRNSFTNWSPVSHLPAVGPWGETTIYRGGSGMQLDNSRREFSPLALRWSSGRCPLCHERVVAPEMSEYVDSGQIRHHWACDGCGIVFSTAIETKALVGAE